MKNKITVVPAILERDPAKLREKLLLASSFSNAVQIDVADGKFVANQTVTDFSWLADLAPKLEIELHLMVADPENYLENLPKEVTSLSIHIETIKSPREFAEKVRATGRKIGFAANPDAPPEEIEKYIEHGDFFQFLTVVPGFQGSEFRADVIEKIKKIHAKYPKITLQADGGITPETAPALVDAGVTILVSGSFIFGHNKPNQAYQELSDSVL